MTATHRDDLGIIVYAPALMGDDGRPGSIVRGMERALSGLSLEWTTSSDGQRTRLVDRDGWLARQKMHGEFPLLSNGNESNFMSVIGWDGPATSSSGRQAQLEVHARLPLTAEVVAATAKVLENIAEGARAFWGHATPFHAGLDIARQTKNWTANPQPPPRGLPALNLPPDLRWPEIPHCLGWLSYWSAATARAIGFPDPARDVDLLARARRTATGGWVVRLTDEPLDLDNPAHLDALLRAYERFPAIGGRAEG